VIDVDAAFQEAETLGEGDFTDDIELGKMSETSFAHRIT
jgi:hypothetical protein